MNRNQLNNNTSNLKTSKRQTTNRKTMNTKSILEGYGLYDDILGIIDDYTVGPKEEFAQRYCNVLDEMEENEFDLELIKSYKPYEMFENIVDTLLFRSVYEYSDGSPGDYWTERSCIPLREWNMSLYENIMLDRLQKKVEKFLKVFPHILHCKELSLVDCNRLTKLLKQPTHRLNFKTYNIQYFVARLQKRETNCRLYFDCFSYPSHIEFDKMENFPDLKIQFLLNQCHHELKTNYNEKIKAQQEKEKEIRMQQNKTFFVGWTYVSPSIPSIQMNDITFKITRVTPKCIYYTKTENGVESEPKRRIIKTTGPNNGIDGIQYFKENRHYDVRATYNMYDNH